MPSPISPSARRSVELPTLLASLLDAEYGLYRTFSAILGCFAVPLPPTLRRLLDGQKRESDDRLMRLAAEIGMHGGSARIQSGPKPIDPVAGLAGLRALQHTLIARLQAAIASGLDVRNEDTPAGLFSDMRAGHLRAAAGLRAYHEGTVVPAA
ncbi:MAG TPA: hypothetical protein VG734_16215 [Lacunisphaera sp.]|nr:hypothetical protein [Lacunisphaera sp.]